MHNIAYDRGMFPEDFFEETTRIAGAKTRELKPKNPEARRLLAQLEKGVFAAVKAKFAKSVTFYIAEAEPRPDGEETILEEYVFNVRYGDKADDPAQLDGVTVRGGSGRSVAEANVRSRRHLDDEEHVRRAAGALIRRLCSMMGTLEPTDERHRFGIKLAYYSHTPDEYQPPFFEAVDPVASTFKPSWNALVGKVETRHHRMDLSIRTVLISDDNPEDDPEGDRTRREDRENEAPRADPATSPAPAPGGAAIDRMLGRPPLEPEPHRGARRATRRRRRGARARPRGHPRIRRGGVPLRGGGLAAAPSRTFPDPHPRPTRTPLFAAASRIGSIPCAWRARGRHFGGGRLSRRALQDAGLGAARSLSHGSTQRARRRNVRYGVQLAGRHRRRRGSELRRARSRAGSFAQCPRERRRRRIWKLRQPRWRLGEAPAIAVRPRRFGGDGQTPPRPRSSASGAKNPSAAEASEALADGGAFGRPFARATSIVALTPVAFTERSGPSSQEMRRGLDAFDDFNRMRESSRAPSAGSKRGPGPFSRRPRGTVRETRRGNDAFAPHYR